MLIDMHCLINNDDEIIITEILNSINLNLFYLDIIRKLRTFEHFRIPIKW